MTERLCKTWFMGIQCKNKKILTETTGANFSNFWIIICEINQFKLLFEK